MTCDNGDLFTTGTQQFVEFHEPRGTTTASNKNLQPKAAAKRPEIMHTRDIAHRRRRSGRRRTLHNKLLHAGARHNNTRALARRSRSRCEQTPRDDAIFVLDERAHLHSSMLRFPLCHDCEMDVRSYVCVTWCGLVYRQ